MIAHIAVVVSVLVQGAVFARQLSPADTAGGWKSLDAPGSWRGYKAAAMPEKGWTLKDGVLTHAAGGGGGDLVTIDEYADFEFAFEFRVAPKANSGIMYRVGESLDCTWMTGPEYQVLDDAGGEGKNKITPDNPHSAGALYDLASPPTTKMTKPAGEWNEGRIRLKNGVLQHWLNGTKTVERVIATDKGEPTQEWKEAVAKSKFKDYKGFGVLPKGRLALQDHGDEVSYRNLRVRSLNAEDIGTSLFNGTDFSGWTPFTPESKPSALPTWSVKEGVLVCTGEPRGYLRTNASYGNFVLWLEWRVDPETKKSANSGVLLRATGPDKVWPKAVEAQLQTDKAGDFWTIDGFAMTVDASRTKGRNTRHTHKTERPLGEWNDLEIIADKGMITLKVNGEVVNRATNAEEVGGFLALQSEGGTMQFRNVRLREIK